MDSEKKTELDRMYKAGFNNAIREALSHVQGLIDRLEPGKQQRTRDLLLALEAKIKKHEKK